VFLRAGYNRRFKTLAVGLGAWGPVYLIEFRPSKDLAWLDRKRGLRWQRPWLRDLIEGPPVHVGLDRCELPQK
jgi:hypothetical protein